MWTRQVYYATGNSNEACRRDASHAIQVLQPQATTHLENIRRKRQESYIFFLDNRGFGGFDLALFDERICNGGHDTSVTNDGILEQQVELLITTDGLHDVAWNDSHLAILLGAIASHFEHLGRKILHNSRNVDTRANTNLSAVLAILELTVHSSNWKH